MATIRTTRTSLEFSASLVWLTAGCAALGLFLLGLAVLRDSDAFKTVVTVFSGFFVLFVAGVAYEKALTRIDLATGIVTVSRQRLRQMSRFHTFSLADLRAVRVERRHGSPATYRVSLATADKVFPLTTAFSSGDGAQRDAEKIQQWLAEQGFDLPLQQSEDSWDQVLDKQA